MNIESIIHILEECLSLEIFYILAVDISLKIEEENKSVKD